MKVKLTFKNPDAMFESLRGMSEEEKEEALEAAERFVKWGEYITVELDTEAKTCTVLPVK